MLNKCNTKEDLKMNKNLVQFIQELSKDIGTVVVIGERTHWVFNNDDEIEEGWAECFEVVEIVSEISTSVIVKVKYLYED